MYIYINIHVDMYIYTHTRTHTHTHIYVYMYLYRERDRERERERERELLKEFKEFTIYHELFGGLSIMEYVSNFRITVTQQLVLLRKFDTYSAVHTLA
jgi:hypothetical protein